MSLVFIHALRMNVPPGLYCLSCVRIRYGCLLPPAAPPRFATELQHVADQCRSCSRSLGVPVVTVVPGGSPLTKVVIPHILQSASRLGRQMGLSLGDLPSNDGLAVGSTLGYHGLFRPIAHLVPQRENSSLLRIH